MGGGKRAVAVRSKIWIETEGEMLFSRGRMLLLRAIDTHGCMHKAACETGISYLQAWRTVRILGNFLERKLVAKLSDHATVYLTEDARDFLARYTLMEEIVVGFTDRTFGELFPEAGMAAAQRRMRPYGRYGRAGKSACAMGKGDCSSRKGRS